MVTQRPVLYLFFGEDEYNITQEVEKLQARLGDPSLVAMNTTRLDGRHFSFNELQNAARAAPFLTERRLVIIDQPTGQLKGKADQQQFLGLLDAFPETTAVIVIERQVLKPEHWLMKWAEQAGPKAFIKPMPLPKGAAMRDWIRKHARQLGGEFSPEGASALAEQVLEDPRTAAQEIEKLLAYAGYRRPVEPEDVQQLTPAAQQGDVFKMVDALGGRDGRTALKMLHQMLDEQEPIMLFGMIVRQFRLLLQTSEMLENNAAPFEIAKALHVQDFIARKLISQCQNFTFQELKAVYRRLLEIDERAKSSQVTWETALDTLVAGLAGGARTDH